MNIVLSRTRAARRTAGLRSKLVCATRCATINSQSIPFKRIENNSSILASHASVIKCDRAPFSPKCVWVNENEMYSIAHASVNQLCKSFTLFRQYLVVSRRLVTACTRCGTRRTEVKNQLPRYLNLRNNWREATIARSERWAQFLQKACSASTHRVILAFSRRRRSLWVLCVVRSLPTALHLCKWTQSLIMRLLGTYCMEDLAS